MTIEEIKDYVDGIHLGDYDLSGVEITEEDFETIKERVDSGQKLEDAVDDYLFEIREVLDEGLDDNMVYGLMCYEDTEYNIVEFESSEVAEINGADVICFDKDIALALKEKLEEMLHE